MRTSIICVLTLASIWFAMPARASSDYWTNRSGDSLWSDPANWSTRAVPTVNDDVVFDSNFYFNSSFYFGSSTVDLGGVTQSAKTVTFRDTPTDPVFQFQNGTLSTSGSVGGGVGPQLFSINISPTPSGGLDLAVLGNVQFSGVIGGNGVRDDNFGVLASGVFTAANTYTGTTNIIVSSMTLSGPNGSIRSSSQINLYAGMFELDNRGGVNNDRVGDNAPLLWQSGTITFDGNSTVASRETMGAVTLAGSTLNLNVYSNGAPATLTLNSLTRIGSTGLELSLASSPGAAPGQLLIQNAASLPMVGGGGAAGSTTQNIVPYAIEAGGSFVTYDRGPDGKLGTADDVGLRPLNLSTEYLPAIPPGVSSTSNIRIIANQTLSQSTTVNALAISNAKLTIPASQQIQLTSGSLSLAGTSSQMTAISGGAINFGSHEALIYTDGPEAETEPRYVVDSQLLNASSITKFGAGTLVLTQPTSFAGTLTINEGLIVSQTNGALGSGNILVGGSPKYGLPPDGIAFENSNQTFSNNISQVPNATSPITINVAAGILAAYSGAITGPLLKAGPGTLWLTDSSSVVNRSTTPSYVFQDGTVRVDTTAHAYVTVGLDAGGLNAVLGGIGTLDSVQVAPFGILWPGAGGQDGSDVLTVGQLSMGHGTFHVSLNGTAPGLQYDQVDVTNILGSLGADLDVTVGYNARQGDQFTIINHEGSSILISGNFAGLPEGATFSAGGDQFQITYQGGDGNDVVLTVLSTPEPSATAFAMACLGGLLLRRRVRACDVRG